jgi:hypothetical protein
MRVWVACLVVLGLPGCSKRSPVLQTKPGSARALASAANAKPSSSVPSRDGSASPSSALPNGWPRACAEAASLRWLGSASNGSLGVRVNTPLAWGGLAVTSAGPVCCAPWSGTEQVWTALDRFGQVAGTARVAKSEYFYFSECLELQLQTLSGTRGVDLWVSAAGSFSPAPSAAWRPKAAEQRGLSTLVKTLEGAMVPGPDAPSCETKVAPLNSRALFYRSRESDDRVHDRAVIGGPLLIIAERDSRRGGAWIASFVDTNGATACLPAQFSPKAVVDMNQDGVPEVVVHTDEGPIFGDLVYGFQQLGGWQVVARGVPGSTA